MLYKTIKFAVILLVSLCASICVVSRAQAEERAEFHVQAAEVKEEGLIRVSVYLTGTPYLGGVDATLTYDSSKVNYVSSGLGASFSDGMGDVYCNREKSTIKCVNIYSRPKIAHGELMYAIFELKEGVSSYQPKFEVVDLVDGSTEIRPIPYSIFYQQADGEWAPQQDTSGETIDEETIAETKEKYGAAEDQEDRIEQELQGTVRDDEKGKTEGQEQKTEEKNIAEQKPEMSAEAFPIYYVVGAVAIFAIIILMIIRRK